MFSDPRLVIFLFVTISFTATSLAQQSRPLSQPGTMLLDVVVSPKSGPPVSGLQQPDFTVLDNGSPQTISSFKVVNGREAPIEVTLVIDAVNAGAETVAVGRTQVEKFFRAEGGHLAYPISLAVLTERGIQVMAGASNDGNALSALLERDDIGLRDVGRSAGYYGATERLQISLEGITALIAKEGSHPGRNIMLWVSPGWPLLSGPNTELDSKQQQQFFANVVGLSTQIRQNRVTIYSVNPLGLAESVGRAEYYQDFLKGVSKPNQVTLGNLGLQVLAVQSGGLVFSSTNDIAKLLQQCLSDSAPYYEIAFNSPAAKQSNEYHHLEIKLAKSGLIARTRQGYYAQPSSGN